jgi:hypothetical protein
MKARLSSRRSDAGKKGPPFSRRLLTHYDLCAQAKVRHSQHSGRKCPLWKSVLRSTTQTCCAVEKGRGEKKNPIMWMHKRRLVFSGTLPLRHGREKKNGLLPEPHLRRQLIHPASLGPSASPFHFSRGAYAVKLAPSPSESDSEV